MLAEIDWVFSEQEAIDRAKDLSRPLMVDFFKEGCGGCRLMDTVTYPNESIATLIAESFVPWRIDFRRETKLLRKFNVVWTPTNLFIDSREREHYRLTGYLPPDVFESYLAMGRAKVAFGAHNYSEAAELFDSIARDYPTNIMAPEAVYFRGVSRQKATGEDAHLDEAAADLKQLYPDSDYVLRTRPWLE